MLATPAGQNRFLANDLTFPRIRLSYSPTYIEVTDTVTFDVEAFDEDGVTSTELKIRVPDASEQILPLVGGSADFVPDAAGEHLAIVTAEDGLGNAGTRSTAFSVLEQDIVAPTVTTTVDPNEVLFGQSVLIEVTATDDRGVVSRRLEVDAVSVPLDSTGQATYVTAATGIHTVTGFAYDAAGNEGSDGATFEVLPDDEDPATSLALSPDTVDLLDPVTITATASDNVGLTSFSVTVTSPTDPVGVELTVDGNGQASYTPYLPGTHTVTVRATDPAGNETVESADFEAEGTPDTTPPTVTLDVAPRTVAIGDSVSITVNATDDVLVASRTLTVNGIPVPLDGSGAAAYLPPVIGTYTAEATVTDPTGNETVETTTFRAIDPASDTEDPTVAITGPADSAEVSGAVPIVGTADDATLVEYSLAYAPLESSDFTTFATGDTAVVGGTLGTLDTTLMENGYYQVRLTAVDANGRAASVISLVNLVGELKLGDKKKLKFSAKPFPEAQQLFPFTVYGPTDMVYEPVGSTDVGTLSASGEDPAWYSPYEILDFSFETYNPSSFTYTAPDGFRYVFSGSKYSVRYKLTRVIDPSGLTIDITPNGFTRSDGLSIGFVRDGQGRITSIADPAGNTVTYEYYGNIEPGGGNGDLKAFTDAEGNRATFLYDDQHYLTEIRDPLGRPVQRNEYDEDGRLIAITDAVGNRIEMEYDLNANTQIIRDRRGNPTIYEYDGVGNIVQETSFPTIDDAVPPATTQRTFDANSQVTREILPDGTENRYAYDNFGNVTQEIKDFGGLALTRTSQYDSAGRLEVQTDARGNTISHSYDAEGNRDTTIYREGKITLYEFTDGQLTRQTDPTGNYTLFEYDGLGNLTAEERWDGNQSVNPLDDTRVRRMEYSYDDMGNRLTETVLVDVSGVLEASTTTFTYDANGQLLTQTDPLGNLTENEYDAVGNRVAEIDPLLNRTEYGYSDLGDLVRVDYPDGGFTLTGYDTDGNRISTTDRNGRTVTYEYDALNRMTRMQFPEVTLPGGGTRVSERVNLYDAVGNLTAEIDESGYRTDHGYDAVGRRASTLQPEVYDAVADALVRPLTLYEYDGNGNRTAVVDANGHRTEYSFDKEDRPTQTLFHDGSTIGVGYDAMGRETSRIDALGLASNFEYDALGRQVKALLPPPAAGERRPETLFTYDELGNLVSQTDANGHTTIYTYDLAGNRLSRTLPELQSESFTYDEGNRLESHVDFDDDTTTFEYDQVGRRTRVDYEDGTSVVTAYTAGGKRLTVVDARGTTSYAYDERGRLTNRTDPDGLAVVYGYTPTGKVETVTTAQGTTSYSYDAIDRLATVAGRGGNPTSHSYDAVGNLVLVERANAAATPLTATRYTYNSRNQLTSVEQETSGGALFAKHVYTLDTVGLRTRMDELPMGNAVTYEYDDNYRLVRETRAGSDAHDIRYAYDPVGNRTQINRDGAVTGYFYDDNDRLTSADGAVYDYDGNGNLTSVLAGGQTTSFTYDAANRMVGSTAPGGEVTVYSYDADGYRVGKSDATGDYRYLLDPGNNTGVVQVLEEHDSGGLAARYAYGLDRLTQERGGVLSYYHADGLGSIRTLTDVTESVTDSYVYDAYGTEIATTGTTENPYRFAGGYQAIGRAAFSVYTDTIKDLFDVKVEVSGILKDLYDLSTGAGGIPGAIPVPEEVENAIKFYEELQGWVDKMQKGYVEARAAYEGIASGDPCETFTQLDKHADTIIGLIPGF